jgi:hypothetical protein
MIMVPRQRATKYVLAQQIFELYYREEQMEFYRDCPIDPDTSSYYCLGGWEEEIRQEALTLTPSSQAESPFQQGCGSGSAWIRINLSCWIRIQEGINDPQI